MDKLLEGALAQAPGLVVLTVVVIFALKAISQIVSEFLEHMKERDAILKQLNQEHLSARVESRDALREVARATLATAEILHELKQAVQGMERR